MEMGSSVENDGHGHGHGPNRFGVLPVALRLGALESATGRGVTIAFLDSGFMRHPDLTRPESRIVAFHDIESPDARIQEHDPQPVDWHGTQTSVVAAGNGFLSGGLYRGLASDARVALVKVGSGGRIGDEDIRRGLEWVLENRERLGIRVCSISLGGDSDAPLASSHLNQLAERLHEQGVVLVVAAGNAGCSEDHHPRPPATAPSAITVGGYDDANELDRKLVGLYCSSFGTSADGIAKPEILAPSIGVAAPILPGTPAYTRAEALSRLAAEPDSLLEWRLAELAQDDPTLCRLAGSTPVEIRSRLEEALRAEKIVATHYQHVEGTSFAAPIVASVVAQMLELSPSLRPEAVKRLLVETAEPSSPFLRAPDGVWRFELRRPDAGRYRYKLVIDGVRWIPDPSHGRREPDPYGDFDSILEINRI